MRPEPTRAVDAAGLAGCAPNVKPMGAAGAALQAAGIAAHAGGAALAGAGREPKVKLLELAGTAELLLAWAAVEDAPKVNAGWLADAAGRGGAGCDWGLAGWLLLATGAVLTGG